MLTVVIKDNGEPKVTQFTYEDLWRELKDIPDAELLIQADWFQSLDKIKNKYVCFVEADCLVTSGYFTSQLGLIKKDTFSRKLAMLTAVTGVKNWANRFYGYEVNPVTDRVTPIKSKRSNRVDTVQIGYVPGSIIRVSMLQELLKTTRGVKSNQDDLVLFSSLISLGFWRQGDGNRVHLNPNAVYVTTEDYVNDLPKFNPHAEDLQEKFERESI